MRTLIAVTAVLLAAAPAAQAGERSRGLWYSNIGGSVDVKVTRTYEPPAGCPGGWRCAPRDAEMTLSYLLTSKKPELVRRFAGGGVSFSSSAGGLLSSYHYKQHNDAFVLPQDSGTCEELTEEWSLNNPVPISGALYSGGPDGGTSADGVGFFVARRGAITRPQVTPTTHAPLCRNRKGETIRDPGDQVIAPYRWDGTVPEGATNPERCCPGPSYPSRFTTHGVPLPGTEEILGPPDTPQATPLAELLNFTMSRRAFGKARRITRIITRTFQIPQSGGTATASVSYRFRLRLDPCRKPEDQRSCRGR